MNRRGVALVIAVVLVIGLGAWWLSALPVEVGPPPPAPVVERVELPAPPPVQLVPPAPAPVVAMPSASPEPDAGVMAEVEIEVVQNGKRVIGVRVALEGPGGRVGRPTDVMGFARFNLPVGSWRITSPTLRERVPPFLPREAWLAEIERVNTVPLEVTAPLTRYRLELPAIRKFPGRVIDAHGQAVIGAKVSWGDFTNLSKTYTDPLGQFVVEAQTEVLRVQAEDGDARSLVRTARPGDPITLVLEAWTRLKVDVPGGCALAFVRVMQRDEIVAVGVHDQWLDVPVGALSVLARCNLKGRAHSGKTRVEAKAGIESRVEVALSPTPPISGTLVDVNGRPMAGLAVHLRQVEFIETPASNTVPEAWQTTLPVILRRGDGGVPALAATTRTNHLGEFSVTPLVGRSPDPIFQLLVGELWQPQADPVLVKLDDAPLTVIVEPAQ